MISLNADPSPRTLRQFGAIAAALLAGIAAARFARHGEQTAPLLLAAVAAVVAVTAWHRPRALRLPYVLLSALMYPVGTVASHVVLLLLFYGMITPLGLVARIMRSDPLRLRRTIGARSYWQRRSRPRDPASYLRQA